MWWFSIYYIIFIVYSIFLLNFKGLNLITGSDIMFEGYTEKRKNQVSRKIGKCLLYFSTVSFVLNTIFYVAIEGNIQLILISILVILFTLSLIYIFKIGRAHV